MALKLKEINDDFEHVFLNEDSGLGDSQNEFDTDSVNTPESDENGFKLNPTEDSQLDYFNSSDEAEVNGIGKKSSSLPCASCADIISVLTSRFEQLENRLKNVEQSEKKTKERVNELEKMCREQKDTVKKKSKAAPKEIPRQDSVSSTDTQSSSGFLPTLMPTNSSKACAVVVKKNKSESNPGAVLNDIIRDFVTLDKDRAKNTVKIIEEFVKTEVIKAMKDADELFKILFSRVYHTGSYYDGLRCGEADEFDLNILLSLKPIEKILDFDTFNDPKSDCFEPGFIRVALTSDSLNGVVTKPDWISNWELFLKTLTELDKSTMTYFLKPIKVRTWIESIFEKAKIKELKSPEIDSVKIIKSGPAQTLKITTKADSMAIDVDFVPTFFFKCHVLENYDKTYDILEKNQWTNTEFFLIPKPCKKELKNVGQLWRMDFHDLEKLVFKTENNGFAKLIIKLIKVMRDSNPVMQGLSSYAIKTTVMHMINAKDNIWEGGNMVNLFLKALDILKELLLLGNIPYFFHPDCDLLWSMSETQRTSLGNWLKRTIKKMADVQNTPECRVVWRGFFVPQK